jgi:anti-sigma B factor antagonist
VVTPGQGEPTTKRVLGRGGLRIEVDSPTDEEGAVVHLFGELDMEATEVLAAELDELIAGPAPSVLVDLTGLEFIDSTGLQCLLRATEHSRANGDKLRFRRGSPQVEGVMRLTKVADLLPFID